jgi:hypothetical protein
VDTAIIRFEAPAQSLWETGANTGEVSKVEYRVPSGFAMGTGVEFALHGDAGTVAGNVEGSLMVRHEDRLATPGPTPVDFMFQGIPGESNISTSIDLGVSAMFDVKLDFPWPIPDVNVTAPLPEFDLTFDLKTHTIGRARMPLEPPSAGEGPGGIGGRRPCLRWRRTCSA